MLKFDAVLPPGELSVLAGASGAGKSTICVQALLRWSTGEDFLSIHPDAPKKIGYIVGDRSVASIHAHIERALEGSHRDIEAVLRDLPIISLVDDENISLTRLKAEPLQLLTELLDNLCDKGCDLIFVDPVMIFLGTDLNRYHMVAPELIKLNRFAKSRNITILGIHHTTKARSDFAFLRPQDRISGSSALSAFTSTQWALWSKEELPDEQREEGLSRLDIISHVAPAEVLWMRRQDNGLFAPHQGPKLERPTGITERLTELISSTTPTPAWMIVSTLEGEASRATVYRALEQLCERGVVYQPAHGFYQRASR